MGDLVGDIPISARPLDFDPLGRRQAGPDLMRFAMALTGNAARRGRCGAGPRWSAVYPRWRRVAARGAVRRYVRSDHVHRRISWWRRLGRRTRS